MANAPILRIDDRYGRYDTNVDGDDLGFRRKMVVSLYNSAPNVLFLYIDVVGFYIGQEATSVKGNRYFGFDHTSVRLDATSLLANIFPPLGAVCYPSQVLLDETTEQHGEHTRHSVGMRYLLTENDLPPVGTIPAATIINFVHNNTNIRPAKSFKFETIGTYKYAITEIEETEPYDFIKDIVIRNDGAAKYTTSYVPAFDFNLLAYMSLKQNYPDPTTDQVIDWVRLRSFSDPTIYNTYYIGNSTGYSCIASTLQVD